MDPLTRVVWICQWYPHEGKPYTGDFIQRHAQAVSQFIPITAFACFEHPTQSGTFTNKNGNLTEVITYYKPINTGIDKIDNALRWIRWYSILKKQLKNDESRFDKPQLLHCHILLNSGWLGLWAKKNWGIPFIASEHWSGFMPMAVNGFDKYNKWSKKRIKTIIKKADFVTGVSNALIDQLQIIEPKGNFIRVPNVVNEEFFNYKPLQKTSTDAVFIHISTGAPQKNISGILAGFALFCKKYPAVKLIMVCPKNGEDYLIPKEIENKIIWKEDMPQKVLAELIRGSDGCILYSNYETFGCVIIEANALGIPAIVSAIPVLQELVIENENGILANISDPADLAKSFEKAITTKFDHKTISEKALVQFSYQIVGQQFIDIYEKILTK